MMAVGVVLLGCGAATGRAASIAEVSGIGYVRQFTPGTDGLLWGVLDAQTGFGPTVVRLGPDGLVTRTVLPPSLLPFDTNGILRPMPDGSMALFERHYEYRYGSPVLLGFTLVRLAPGTGAITSVHELPAIPPAVVGVTVAPDGAIWFARACKDEVDRIDANGVVTRVRLPKLGCEGQAVGGELGTGLAFDPTGALWFVNLCQGRIVHISVARHIRTWQSASVYCPEPEVESPFAAPATIEPDPRGGIAFASNGVEFDSGRITHGRLDQFTSDGAGLFSSDGALWRASLRDIELRAPGKTRSFPTPTGMTPISNLVLDRSGNATRVDASYWKTYPGDSHDPYIPVYLSPRVDMVDARGSDTTYPLAHGGADEPTQIHNATIALAPDGALWLQESRYADESDSTSTLLRLVPDGLAMPQRPLVRVQASVARLGGALWIQA